MVDRSNHEGGAEGRFNLVFAGSKPDAPSREEHSFHSATLPGVFRFLYTQPLGARLFPFRGLARFKEKFSPEWVPVRIGAYKNVSVWSLYEGCRIWGLFDEFPLDSARWPCPRFGWKLPGTGAACPFRGTNGAPEIK